MLVESFSGIRGIADQDLTKQIIQKYGYSYYSLFTPKNLVIGRDTRPSSARIQDQLIQSIPCDIIDVGVLSTPAIQQSVRHFQADGGIIVTGSHNEPEWNGIKFLDSSGAVLDLEHAEKLITKTKTINQLQKDTKQSTVTEKSNEALVAYQKFLYTILGEEALTTIKNSNLSVVLDPNGGAGVIAKHILEQAGITVHEINAVPGLFNRNIEPNQESLSSLTQHLDAATFGAGFDCDADRVELVLKNGDVISGNQLLAIVVKAVLESISNPSKEIVVVNDATSYVVRDVAKSYGATLVEVGVGETNVVQEMKRQNSKVGGEGSSSGCILTPATCRDGILTILVVASYLGKTKKTIEQVVEELPTYVTLRKNIPLSSENIQEKIKDHYTNEIVEKAGSIKVLISPHSFVWFRLSKTEGNLLRVIADAPSQKEAETLLNNACQLLPS